MNGLRERLERLRAAAAAEEKLRQGERDADLAGGGAAQAEPHGGPAPDEEAGALHPAFREIGVKEIANEAGAFLLRTVAYPLSHRHGRYRLNELIDGAPRVIPIACRQNGKVRGSRRVPAEPTDLPVPQARSLLFLDTETTGLGVGAGNVPFMIGIGTYAEAHFTVEQCLIRHPGEERAMLAWLTDKFAGVTHLVTYNGRSFDWPVLEGRFILNGWRRKGPGPGHLDFLHPSRALWKNTLPTCRLGTVEEERLGIVRAADVPGSLAPELYMRYLRDGDPRHLHGVFLHNERDILSLAALAIHFGHLLGGGLRREAPDPVDAEERFRTGAWLELHGQAEEAARLYALLAEEPQQERAGDPVGWRLSLAAKFKRLGSTGRAVPMWEQAAALAESARVPRVDAHLELAIHYAHRAKDFAATLKYAEAAHALLLRRMQALRTSSAAREEKVRLERRIERLRRKLSRQASVAGGESALIP